MTEPLVRKVDHVFVPVADPAPLFTLFTQTLELPVAWPIFDHGIIVTGGVCLGNMDIEFICGDPSTMRFFVPTEPLTVRGIAFEPEDGDAIEANLAERRLAHTDPAPFADAKGRPLWTNVFLEEMVANAAAVFLCAFHGRTALDLKAIRESFPASQGGVLGVRRVAEITVGVCDLEATRERWRRFLAPLEPDEHGAFRFHYGPAIRLRRSPIDVVIGLWLEVASLDAARDALRELDLLGPTRASGVGLDYAQTGGLDVWLTEPR